MDPSWKWCPVCIAPLRGWLVHLNNDKTPKRVYTIHEGTSFIGKGVECEIRVSDAAGLLRRHASLTVDPARCSIMNMDADHPLSLRVNSQDKVGATLLIDGDVILLADTLFKIKLLT
ncbi:MAG: FHA domain-containing protein [Treponema sp.]|jgi:pSer/pThr/pTyr-binding forkhead associated (FHA) protein|nr:FHA domain-containing protein [Treponema sp.]